MRLAAIVGMVVPVVFIGVNVTIAEPVLSKMRATGCAWKPRRVRLTAGDETESHQQHQLRPSLQHRIRPMGDRPPCQSFDYIPCAPDRSAQLPS